MVSNRSSNRCRGDLPGPVVGLTETRPLLTPLPDNPIWAYHSDTRPNSGTVAATR